MSELVGMSVLACGVTGWQNLTGVGLFLGFLLGLTYLIGKW